MTIRGRVRFWNDDEGWGVVDSEHTPGGCWAHFSSVLVAGFRTLSAGQEVELVVEQDGVEQDGYSFRAAEVWPTGSAPVRDAEIVVTGSTAYESVLTLTFDDVSPSDDPGTIPQPDDRESPGS